MIKPADKLNIVSRNRLDTESDEIFRASITPSDGQLFIRSDQVLWCLGARTKEPERIAQP